MSKITTSKYYPEAIIEAGSSGFWVIVAMLQIGKCTNNKKKKKFFPKILLEKLIPSLITVEHLTIVALFY